MSIPIIRLEIEGIKQTMFHALSQRVLDMDAHIKSALDAYCTPENLDYVIRQTATAAIDAAVKEEVRRFFQHSSEAGRQAVRAAVNSYLNKVDSWYAIDEDGDK